MENVRHYKYLGIDLNTTLDSDLQWQRVQTKIASLPYLLRQLKLQGWSQHMLVDAYRAYGLSHITYSAPVLTSASIHALDEMMHFQKAIMKIIGIDSELAATKYRVIPIIAHIDATCSKVLIRLINDPSHPIFDNLHRSNRLASKFPLTARLAKSEKYSNSFLPKYIRALTNRANCNNPDARANLYQHPALRYYPNSK